MITKHIMERTVDFKTIKLSAGIFDVLDEDFKPVTSEINEQSIPSLSGLSVESFPGKWEATIDVETGRIVDWPKNKPFKLRLVCVEAFSYTFYDEQDRAFFGRYDSADVPSFMNPAFDAARCADSAFNQSVIIAIDIDENGCIIDWEKGRKIFARIFDIPNELIDSHAEGFSNYTP